MKINVRNKAHQRLLSLEVHPLETIRQLKSKIEKQENIDPEEMTLLFKDQPLIDSNSLDFYKLADDAELKLVLSNRKGSSDTKVHPDGKTVGTKTHRSYKSSCKDDVIENVRRNALPEGIMDIDELKNQFLEESAVRKEGREQYFTIGKNKSSLTAVAISEDRKYVASGTGEGLLNLYNYKTKELVHSFEGVHDDTIRGLVFTKGDKYILTGDDAGTVRMINFETKQVDHVFANIHTQRIISLRLSPDKKYFVTGSQDKSIQIFDIETKKNIHHFTKVHADNITAVVYTHDNKIVSASDDGQIKILDVETKKEVATIQQSGGIYTLAVSNDLRFIATGGFSSILRIFDYHAAKEIKELPKVGVAPIKSILFSNDNRFVIAGHQNGILKIYSPESGHEIHSVKSEGSIATLAISEDDQYIASGGSDSSNINGINIFQLQMDPVQLHLENIHKNWVRAVCITHDNKYLITGSGDKTIKIFDIASNEEVKTITSHEAEINALAASYDNKFFVSASSDKSIKIFDLANFNEIHTFKDAHSTNVSSVVITQDNNYIVTGGWDHHIKIFDLRSRTLVHEFKDAHKSLIFSVALSPDDKYIVSCCMERIIKIFDFNTKAELHRFEKVHLKEIHKVSVTKNFIVTCSDDKSIKLINLKTKELVHCFEDVHDRTILSAKVSHDEKFLVSISADKTVKIFDIKTKKQLCHFKDAHTNAICSLAISSDSKYFATGGYDNSVKLYQFPFFDKRRNFLYSSTISPTLLIGDYEKFILKIADDLERNKNLTIYQDLYYLPVNWNILHLLAIFEHVTIKKIPSYSEVKMPFLLDNYNKTPLHYLINQPKLDYQSVEVLLNYMIDYLEDPEVTSYEKQSIISSLSDIYLFIISQSDLELSTRFLKLCTKNPSPMIGEKLPHFGTEDSKSYISDNFVFTKDVKDKLYTEGHEQISLKSLCLNLDYRRLSNDMLDSALVLSEIEDEEVFRSSTVSNLIDHLWNTSWLFHTFIGLIFSALMILISTYIGIGGRVLGLEIAIFVITVFFIMFEAIQIYKLRSKYVLKFWNIMDFCFLLLIIATMITRFTDATDNDNAEDPTRGWLYSVIIILGYMRWLSYMRLFNPTRKLVRVILGVINGMWGFTLILLLIIIGFSLIFLEFDRETDYLDHLYNTYNILYGPLDYAEYTPSQKILLGIIAFAFNIVLLNMLIALMGDSYGQVVETEVLTDSLEKLDMIIESAMMMRFFWPVGEEKKGYLLLCRPSANEEREGGESIDKKISVLKDLISKNEGKMEQMQMSLQKLENKMNVMMDRRMKDMEERMDSNHKELIKKLDMMNNTD